MRLATLTFKTRLQKHIIIEDNHIQNVHLGRYIVGYTFGNRDFRPYMRRYTSQRTSDGGNGNHRVWLPIILTKIKGDQMLPSSYVSSLLVSFL